MKTLLNQYLAQIEVRESPQCGNIVIFPLSTHRDCPPEYLAFTEAMLASRPVSAEMIHNDVHCGENHPFVRQAIAGAALLAGAKAVHLNLQRN
ncbi:MAG TPA: hypothetical protein P5205_11095 [Candidatus Paceibacterota bacterium]|nr:hypothetical protein [Verrucomicrobiota bacterium]HSA10903.1 hypothetical protein [Candidatus Paceibacterota bacterium]